jgi:ribosome-binding factor A
MLGMGREQRLNRVADHIQRELSDLIRRELRDPRVRFVTLSGVELSPDRSHATVFFTCMEAGDVVEASEGLNSAAGFLRSGLAKRITTFTTPDLRFRYDESVVRGAYLSKLIDQVNSKS